MKCLFLGHNSSQTRLINFLKKKKILVTHKKRASKKGIEKFDLIISFGCRQIIKSDILRKVKRPILNLHMSYLPFNKGSYPNFWSFRDNTKKGVTIHEIDKNLGSGPIIFQKEIKFNIQKNKKITFKSTYNILFLEIEKLFIKNFKSIIFNNYRKKKKNKVKGTIHYVKDLPKDLKEWNVSIFDYLNNFITYEKVSTNTHAKLLWRLNTESCSRMYSKRPKKFSYKNHLMWLEKVLKTDKEHIFLAKKNKEIIGIIRRKKNENKLFLSWAIVKKFRNKKYGGTLVKDYVKKNNNTFFAEVHKHNIKSIKICENSGFKLLDKKNNFLLYKKNKF